VNVMVADVLRQPIGPTGDQAAPTQFSDKNVGQLVVLNRGSLLSFTSASSSAAEEVGSPGTIVVAGSTVSTIDVSATYTVTGGTATSGADYILASGTVTVAAGTPSTTLPLSILDDTRGEYPETITITLSAPANGGLGATTTHTFTIVDTDPWLLTDAWPVDADGDLIVGADWGAWEAEADVAGVTSMNYLRLRNNSPAATLGFAVDFVSAVFTGPGAATLPLDGNIRFSWWEDTTPATSAPSEGTYAFGGLAPSGKVTGAFTGLERTVYVTYQVASIPALAEDGSYSSDFQISYIVP